MKLSISVPQSGALATARAVDTVAAFAESEGLHGAWVFDRLLMPVDPRDPYPATPDGSLSPEFERVLDPLQVLAAVAARTERIRVGTNVLVLPWYNPVVLGRSLATLDVLSGGRLDVGFGVGWSRDERVATGAPEQTTTEQIDEFLDVLVASWTNDVVAHDGHHYRVPASRIGLRPAQHPHPPLLFAAYSPPAMRRIARIGDGWMPAGLPIDPMVQMWTGIRQMAEGFGRDVDALRLIVRGQMWTSSHVAGERPLFGGDAQQIADDVARCQEIGADEVILDAQFTEAATGLDRFTDAVGSIVDRSLAAIGASV